MSGQTVPGVMAQSTMILRRVPHRLSACTPVRLVFHRLRTMSRQEFHDHNCIVAALGCGVNRDAGAQFLCPKPSEMGASRRGAGDVFPSVDCDASVEAEPQSKIAEIVNRYGCAISGSGIDAHCCPGGYVGDGDNRYSAVWAFRRWLNRINSHRHPLWPALDYNYRGVGNIGDGVNLDVIS
jgi:hypothetical protein